ncbi:hypothetical protein [Roseovarius sp. D0-M9]|uniref:hypothetical protein n=1 Tax=Roseovarius sp. D0-M9 TaxID=3127117 RepID=UPI00300FB5D2
MSIGGNGSRELVSPSWGFRITTINTKSGKTLQAAAWNNVRDDKERTSGLWRDAYMKAEGR